MTFRITWMRAIVALLGISLVAMLFAWSGAMQISASSGHWRITDWFLHWVMRNSVRTYSAFQTPSNPLDEDGLISAAGHFRQACQVCHGAPGVRPSPVMQSATPPAPDLAKTAGEWRDRELFWIIRHGVKFTGMPAWAASDRPDEVRRMTAFVRRLPGMTAQQYRTLTHASDETRVTGIAPATLAACTGCHGTEGRGRGQPDIPVLGGQNPAYLLASLRRYASGERSSAVMQTAVATLNEEEMTRLASHFAAMPGLDAKSMLSQLAPLKDKAGLPIPTCRGCHAPGKAGPVLADQKASYLAARLRGWQHDTGTVDARKSPATMAMIARRIPDDQIDALATSVAASEEQGRDVVRRGVMPEAAN
ncbi:c-type cytochrome [Sphingobium sp. CR2-8]|uniref:c-type cytochrome n=1 Tax=Sphingobium sp. CR2-8 TaxID=1306534 RepID=UPI002DBF63A1|nr:c-type cytochrome [Sphingobium sp. CR2-8]MEC3910364.1 c-type cytochrome [Sphingobium sp. CR2-8]